MLKEERYLRLKDRVAIVTGASGGNGQAIAKAMAEEGAKVVVADILEQQGLETVKEISNAGLQAVFVKVDVSDSSEITTAVKTVLDQFGRIDILVNNAGVPLIENFHEGDEQHWDKVIAVNLMGVMVFTHSVLPGMIERKYGKIINIASTAAILAGPRQVVYSASKGGVVAFTRSLAAEMARHHINVVGINPGFIITPMSEKGREMMPGYFAKVESNIPWGRPGIPEDVAKLAVFLASDDSEYITGQCITIGGGLGGI